MIKSKKKTFWLLPTVVLMLLAFMFTTIPVHAAGEDEDGSSTDTTGQTEASVSFTAGELKLESAPVLDFGSHPISNVEQTYAAESVSPNVQVSDLRGGGNGWELYVSLSPFALEGSGTTTLKAATIRFTSPTVSALNSTVGTPPSAAADVILTSDSTETPILTAEANEGMGVWGLVWSAANTTLTVKPGTAQEGKSVASLTWTLQNTP